MSSGQLGSGNPIELMERMFSEFFSGSPLLGQRSQLTGGGGSGGIGGSQTLPVDLIETQENYQVLAELPGVQPQEVDVTINGDTLTLRAYKQAQWQSGQQGQQGQQEGSSGSRQQQQQAGQQGGQQGQQIHRVERAYGEIRRSFQLPPNCDRDRIQAQYNNGLLTLTIPKSQEAQKAQKRIEVKAQNT